MYGDSNSFLFSVRPEENIPIGSKHDTSQSSLFLQWESVMSDEWPSRIGTACIQKQLTSTQETQSELIDTLNILQQKVDTSCQLYTTLRRMVHQSESQQEGQQSQALPQLRYQVPFVLQPPR